MTEKPDTRRIKKGRRGEDQAALALIAQGYQILTRNWRCAEGEIDLIATHGAELVFVEVRYRRDGLETALACFTSTKIRKVEACVAVYLASMIEAPIYRIDFVAVAPDGLEIIQNANAW